MIRHYHLGNYYRYWYIEIYTNTIIITYICAVRFANISSTSSFAGHELRPRWMWRLTLNPRWKMASNCICFVGSCHQQKRSLPCGLWPYKKTRIWIWQIMGNENHQKLTCSVSAIEFEWNHHSRINYVCIYINILIFQHCFDSFSAHGLKVQVAERIPWFLSSTVREMKTWILCGVATRW